VRGDQGWGVARGDQGRTGWECNVTVTAMAKSLLDLSAETVLEKCKYNDLSLLPLPPSVYKFLQVKHKNDCNSCDVLYYTGNICKYCHFELCETRKTFGLKTPYFEKLHEFTLGPLPYEKLMKILNTRYRCTLCDRVLRGFCLRIGGCRCDW